MKVARICNKSSRKLCNVTEQLKQLKQNSKTVGIYGTCKDATRRLTETNNFTQMEEISAVFINPLLD